MQIKQKALGYVLILAISLQSCTSSKFITLNFNPTVGKKYKHTVIIETTSNQEVMGQKVESKQNMTMYATYTITKSEEDKEFTVIYDRIISQQSIIGKDYVIDTDAPDTMTADNAKLQANIFNALKGKAFTVVLGKDGSVKAVKGFEETINKVIAKVPSKGPESDAVVKMMKSMFGDTFIKSMFTQAFKIFPDKKVSVNSSWNNTMNIKTIFGLQFDNTVILKSFDDKKATLSIQSIINAVGDMELLGMKINADLKGTANGTTELERNTGMVLHSIFNQDIKGVIKMMGMEVPMSIKQKTTIVGQPL